MHIFTRLGGVSYQVFARKYRPRTFDDVLGQDHVVSTLRNAIEKDRLAHAWLFVGPRGTGKTTTARILAKALNCPDGPKVDFNPDDPICMEIAEGTSLDVLEIDGASNNGVDQVRDLRENVQFAPSSGKYKIYYIDEVHMLSTAAFNALLKTLEEPPEHVKFIFATTEPNKILPTIISRCQRYDLRPIPTETIAKHLQYIASEEGVKLDDAAAWAVAKGADGGMRDAQSMLDQLVAFCGEEITEQNVLDIFGFTSRETVASLVTAICQKDSAAAMEQLRQQSETGKDLGQLLSELIGGLRALLVNRLNNATGAEGFSDELWKPLVETAKAVSTERLLNMIDILAESEGNMKWTSNKRLHFEIGLIKSIQSLNEARISDVIKALAGAGPVDSIPAEAPATPTPAPVPTSEPEATPEPPVEKPAPATPTSSGDEEVSGFAKMAEDAPEESEEPEPQPTPPSNANNSPAPQAPAEETPAAEESKKLDDDFYQDPLIQKALEVFEGSIKN